MGNWVLLFHFSRGAFSQVLVVRRVVVSEQHGFARDGCPLQSPTSNCAHGASQKSPLRPEGMAHFADPAFRWDLRQPNASLMNTDVARGTEDNQIVVSIIPVSADLALHIFNNIIIAVREFWLLDILVDMQLFELLLLEVIEELGFFGMGRADEFKGVVGERDEVLLNMGESAVLNLGFEDGDHFVQGEMEDGVKE